MADTNIFSQITPDIIWHKKANPQTSLILNYLPDMMSNAVCVT